MLKPKAGGGEGSSLRVIAFVLSYKEKPIHVLKSLSIQTLKPEKVVIVAAHKDACVDSFEGLGGIDCLVVKPDHRLTVGERVGISLTAAFRKYRLEDYDYFLKLDDDVVFGPRFIEANVGSGYDVMGRGAAMVVNARKYLKLFGGRWPACPVDDSYVVYKSIVSGLKVIEWDWVEKAKLLKKPTHGPRRLLIMGRVMYRFGTPFPYTVLSSLKRVVKGGSLSYLVIIYGHLVALLARDARYDFSTYVREYIKRDFIRKISKIARQVRESVVS